MADYVGTSNDDKIVGGSGTDFITGDGGADQLSGGGGDDVIFSHVGDPNVTGTYFPDGTSFDRLAEQDTLIGGAGDDHMFAGYGDSADGGSIDWLGNRLYVSFMGATSGVNADFRALQGPERSLTIGGGTFRNIQNIGYLEGSDYDDLLVPIDTYYPSGGDVFGRGGDDHIIADYYSGWSGTGLWGGDGNDLIDATTAQYGPAVYGEAGDDVLMLRSGLGDYADGGDGNDTIYAGGGVRGGAGDDLIVLQNSYYAQEVFGDGGKDEIRASSSGNVAYGGRGADLLVGSDGNDQFGSADQVARPGTPDGDMGVEKDELSGAGGDDRIAMGIGDDADGGAGTDRLRLSLGGATGGVNFSSSGITGAGTFTFAEGTIRNFEIFESLIATDFADRLNIATQTARVTIDAAGGDDIVKANGGAVALLAGSGNDRFINGSAADRFDGGEGIDTYDNRAAGAAVTVTLGTEGGGPGTGTGDDILVAVENVDGSDYGDTISGSDLANRLDGSGGDDTLNGLSGDDVMVGGVGTDTMNGGFGNDIFYVDSASDTIVEAAGRGEDRVYAAVSYALAEGQEVEILAALSKNSTGDLKLTGNELANRLIGNAGQNLLVGLDGSDQLDGATGADRMSGGAGNDAYIVDNAGDVAVETADSGTDSLVSSVSFALGANIERLTLAGTKAIDGTGNLLANVIVGNTNNNVIDGRAGADRMSGGFGDDHYVVDNAGDLAVEAADAGTDLVTSSIGFTLGANVERLTLAGNGRIDGTGNALANLIVGNSNNNLIDGRAGADRMSGGAGDDRYIVDDAGDLAVEADDAGIDSVTSMVSFALGANVERLTLAGNGEIDGTGNGLANLIVGNASNNVIDGRTGADRMSGGAGDDRYFVDNGLDVVAEAADAGIDSVVSRISFSLGAHVERLTLSGTGDIDGTGNGLANAITGNGGHNELAGGAGADRLGGGDGGDRLHGGAGSDILTGGGGEDGFYFDSALKPDNVDLISDFAALDDTIFLDRTVFAAIAADGSLAASALHQGAVAADADDRILYDQATGRIFYDSDGTGSAAALLFARVDAGTALTNTDFHLVG